ncbi:type II toxin-antitoxin system VapC family toxin [Candidatus Bathyarchaeota archaeon]|nr:type II toxin-antitoxin system VapC family toxin [Candidatus Bathyarchaeota archaeon]MBS7613652.1 type II toxin-antitoxin system VapC family toxin [Candidatus Bathyarchaeota archaeon]MBS7617448.1 type II toxin-antitoxin system VapC family toxin [Candidatus Bathyarchaeota archaeon]
MKVYLDSSAIVKRYVSEPGSSTVDYVFDRGWIGDVSIAISIWNIGEVLGVLSERRRRKWFSEEEFMKVFENFAGETVRLLRLKVLEVIPLSTSILIEAWPLILKDHIYEADAIQIQSCIYSNSNVLLSGDEKLIEIALKTGLNAVNVKDEDKVKELVERN